MEGGGREGETERDNCWILPQVYKKVWFVNLNKLTIKKGVHSTMIVCIFINDLSKLIWWITHIVICTCTFPSHFFKQNFVKTLQGNLPLELNGVELYHIETRKHLTTTLYFSFPQAVVFNTFCNNNLPFLYGMSTICLRCHRYYSPRRFKTYHDYKTCAFGK